MAAVLDLSVGPSQAKPYTAKLRESILGLRRAHVVGLEVLSQTVRNRLLEPWWLSQAYTLCIRLPLSLSLSVSVHSRLYI